MNDEGTRIEISPELHETIKAVIKERKSNGDMGVTQKKILEELCQAGLVKSDTRDDSSGNAAHNPTFSGITPMFLQGGSYVVETKPQLKKMQEALYEKEGQLLKREKQLTEREVIINDKFITYFNEKEKSLGQEKSSRDGDIDLMKFLESRLNEKDDHILELNDMIRKLEEDLGSRDDKILHLLEKVERNTRKDTFFDEILPILTPALLGLKIFQDNEEKNKTENQNVVDLLKNFTRLSSFKQKKYLNDIKNEANTPGASIEKSSPPKKQEKSDKK